VDAAVLGWLALAVVLNASVTALLAALIIRSSLGSSPADPGRRGTAPGRQASGPAAYGAALGATPGRAVGAGSGAASGAADPLAGAISAFLGRSDGLFRAGGPPPSHPGRPAGPSRQAVGPGARARGSTPGPSSGAQRPAPGPTDPPEPRPPIVTAHDRPHSEVTWATSRPSRFVPSGPHSPEARDPEAGPDPASDATSDAGPAVEPGSTGPIGPGAASDAPGTAPAGRAVSRVSIALSNRDGSGAGAGPAAVARLGPVIGGLLRERTRRSDRVSGLTGARFSLILPDTSLDGAAALTRRLAQSCDAWLAAEQPPLRLEFGWVDLPADAVSEGPVTVRLSGPERRRAVPQDA
jgi:hypothetical protein